MLPLLLLIVLVSGTLSMHPARVNAQVPMLFIGTASLDGKPVNTGTKVEIYTAKGVLLASTETGLSGTPNDSWLLTPIDPSLEDQLVYFYLVIGDKRLPTPEQAQITARYDAELGPGRTNVAIAVKTPPVTPAASASTGSAATGVAGSGAAAGAAVAAGGTVVTIPLAPLGIVASVADGSNYTGTRISWGDEATNETGYELWRWDEVDGWTVVVLDANSVNYLDRNNIIRGLTYHYYLGSYNTVGYSKFVYGFVTVARPSPTNLRATAELNPARPLTYSVRLSWRDLTERGQGNYYELWRWEERDGWSLAGEFGANTISHIDEGRIKVYGDGTVATWWYYLASVELSAIDGVIVKNYSAWISTSVAPLSP